MLCMPSITDQDACDNCGQPIDAGRECPAEATTTELLAMRAGKSPGRCVELTPYQVRRLANASAAAAFSQDEINELFPSLGERDETLIGNRLELLFKQLGVPPCPGCIERRDYLNRAHALVRGMWGLA